MRNRGLSFVLVLAALGVAACQPRSAAPVTGAGVLDSARAVEAARRVLGDTAGAPDRVVLRVTKFARDSAGFVVQLMPVRHDVVGGDGLFWIAPDGRILRTELGQ